MSKNKTLEVQLQIRQNAEEMSSALYDVSSWEKKMKEKDKAIKRGEPAKAKIRAREGGTVPLKLKASAAVNTANGFTPASIVDKVIPSSTSASKVAPVVIAAARGHYENKDLEEVEREKGNSKFKQGNFTAAVKSYTKCLGLKSDNYIAFSNRAMAYLKLKEYHRALIDCVCALKIDPSHVKSLLRRATALNSLGRHQAAMQDLLYALELEPTNKQAKADYLQTKEMIRQAMNRAPFTRVLSYQELLANRKKMSKETEEDKYSRAIVEATAAADVDDATAAYSVPEGPDPRPANFIPSTTTIPDLVSADGTGIEHVVKEDMNNNSSSNGQKKKIVVIEENEEEEEVEESATNNPPLSNASSNMHRISIVQEAEEEEDGNEDKQQRKRKQTIISKKAISATRIAIIPEEEGEEVDTDKQAKKTTKKASASSSASSSGKRPSSTSSSSSSSLLMGAYELEKFLLQYHTDITKLQSLFFPSSSISSSTATKMKQQSQYLQPKDCRILFKNLVEPEVLYLLLSTVLLLSSSTNPSAEHAVSKMMTVKDIIAWFTVVKALPAFSLLYSLMASDQRQKLHAGLLAQIALNESDQKEGEDDEERKESERKQLQQLLTAFEE